MRDSGAFLFVSPSGAKLPRAARQGRGNKQHSVSTDPLRPAARLTTFTPAPANRKKKKSKLVQPKKGVSRVHLRFHHRPWDPAGPANQRGPQPPKKKKKKIQPVQPRLAGRDPQCTAGMFSICGRVWCQIRSGLKPIQTNCNHVSSLCGIKVGEGEL